MLSSQCDNLRERNGGMSRRELCDLIASLEHDNDEMRKKLNALKAHDIEIVDGVAGGYEIYDARTKEVDRLLYENANLRDLATLLKTCNHYAMLCEHCPFQGELDSFGNFTCHVREKSNQLSETFGIGEI